ncbi:mitochondrial carrier domain-containing protein [Rhodocollybia butyracea]|uniref:Mitochondrial carrier domain-containing protein n=1 Tax=Rhodocollybia butyracea TaxID=206335 RepID=A0A9P5UEY5_9AGAR|nr:mitochondrial carrier domain-containing protein [Rhodocollybia butyracea]
MPQQPASFFPTTALDHAAAGLGAGVVSTLCMNPLDLLKVKFQVATTSSRGGIGKQIWHGLRDIYRESGFKGLYRGVGPNVAGNASSWGLYFLFYNMLKKRASGGDLTKPLSAQEILICSAQASAVTAVTTNPIWVVKVRMFTSPPGSSTAYRSLFHGFNNIVKTEGVKGLFRGTSLALFGVSNGALQFMTYEKMKKWGFDMKRQRYLREGREWDSRADKLSNTSYTVMSASSKLLALSATYPYQVVRSRIQNDHRLYPNITSTIARTWHQEGFRGFYRGLATNLVRILPGTCVTFVVYENLAWLLRSTAAKRIKWKPEEDSRECS